MINEAPTIEDLGGRAGSEMRGLSKLGTLSHSGGGSGGPSFFLK